MPSRLQLTGESKVLTQEWLLKRDTLPVVQGTLLT